MDKMLRQKVAEVEKLTQTVRELEEAVLAGGAAANAVRDYQRKVQEMNVIITILYILIIIYAVCCFESIADALSCLYVLTFKLDIGGKENFRAGSSSCQSYCKQGCDCSCKRVERC